jgi:hypothetical protein
MLFALRRGQGALLHYCTVVRPCARMRCTRVTSLAGRSWFGTAGAQDEAEEAQKMRDGLKAHPAGRAPDDTERGYA